mgnify:CR=1 FL=1
MNQIQYPKRLIEVDLPIKEISRHARREKSIRHGHISTLHIWWARRPLAACRAVICAALWPDPADPQCPEKFKEDAAAIMARFKNPLERTDLDYKEPLALRKALLDFIADFANWDNSTDERYLETSRALTQSAHVSLGGAPGSRPLVVDPFAGGGSIPLEALRVGADAFASDLNPIAVLLNKVILDYIPCYGQKLADEVRKWGYWIKVEAEKELAELYPKDPDGATPIAYLWARTITCEGPGCGTEIPMIRSLWMAKKGKRSVALKIIPDREKKRIEFQIISEATPQVVGEGTVRRGSATCPVCGYTTPVASVREQLKACKGGINRLTLYCVVAIEKNSGKTVYRPPYPSDLHGVEIAEDKLDKCALDIINGLALLPDEQLPIMSGVFNAPIYGHSTWGSLFTPRQAFMLSTFSRIVREAPINRSEARLETAIRVLLALTISKMTDFHSSLCVWRNARTCVAHTFGRQALPMVWDFGEMNPFIGSAGDFGEALEYILQFIEHVSKTTGKIGYAENADAAAIPLPSDSATLIATDPPYYNAVPYADLSDFFFVWLRRMLFKCLPDNFAPPLTPKKLEICEMAGWDPIRYSEKNGAWFEKRMSEAMTEARRVAAPNSLGVVVFAHKTTSGWEAQLQAMIQAGWIFTGSWPIDTERSGRLRAHDSAALASSIHLVCRPREDPSGDVREDDVGDWREVLSELPQRIHNWLPRLAQEGVVGADAIFSCLGPALEIYSRYSRVEKASGEQVFLSEYLQEVWAAVSREALGTIFSGDTSSFEEDARITAMWLWTLTAGANGNGNDNNEDVDPDQEETESPSKSKLSGFILEFDAARKITQGLGVRLENLSSLVEVKGDKARLLPVSERAPYLLGQEPIQAKKRKIDKTKQMTLAGGESTEEIMESPAIDESFSPGSTTLDRVHQAMLLFGEGRGDGLKSFLQEIGQDQGFWSLSQALNSLYPVGSEERRWVEGVLARKKSMGL